MMHIDTYEAFKQLIEAGVEEKAAETIIKVIDEVRRSGFYNLATKEDLTKAINEVKLEMADLKGKFGTMQWMMGFLLAMCSAIILKLFW